MSESNGFTLRHLIECINVGRQFNGVIEVKNGLKLVTVLNRVANVGPTITSFNISA